MAKRKRPKPQSSLPEATHINLGVRLPMPVYRFCVDVAKLTDVGIEGVLQVILASHVVKRGEGNSS